MQQPIPPLFGNAFVLQRDLDHTGVSGTGTVADGVEFPDGTVAVRWRGEHASTVVWASLADALHVHGHGGATRVVWATEGSKATHAAPLVELRVPRAADPATAGVLDEIAAERVRQNEKWGPQNHPDGTGQYPETVDADVARMACQNAAAGGYLDWLHIMREEVAEAFAETDPARLRAELLQVAAVTVAWVEAIDRRAMAGAEDMCRVVEIDGEPIRVRGDGELTDRDRAALAEVLGAARRKFAAEHPEEAPDGATVAYRTPDDVLTCIPCGKDTPGAVALADDDLPNGGLCAVCDVDVYCAAEEAARR